MTRRAFRATGVNQDRLHLAWHQGRGAAGKGSIHCNLTLLFGMHQAVACAEAKVTLISPFVGASSIVQERHGQGLPGRRRSRRAVGDQDLQLLQEVRLQDGGDGRELSQYWGDSRAGGCDLLTIAPKLLEELQDTQGDLPASLIQERPEPEDRKDPMDEAAFEKMHAEDRMAHDKLKEGIEGFSEALEKLENLLADRLAKMGAGEAVAAR